MRFEAIIDVPADTKLNIGKVGPWPPDNPKYLGGEDQIVLPRIYPENVWVKQIKDKQTGKLYSYGDFRIAFPNLCK